MIFKMDPLTNLKEALVLATIRNECRLQMTNNQQIIHPEEQIAWFEQIYTQQQPQNYRVWLLKETSQESESIIGYFATKETPEGFYITEGLLEKKRGIGGGTFILKSMLSAEWTPKKTFLADIFNSNTPSIRLHLRYGFKKHILINEWITRYILEVLS